MSRFLEGNIGSGFNQIEAMYNNTSPTQYIAD